MPIKNYLRSLAVTFLLAGSTATFSDELTPENVQNFKPAGKFVVVNNAYKIYLDCKGQGSPAIMIEPGVGDTSANWLPIQKELSKHTKTCVYDRAGTGLSVKSVGPRIASVYAEELRALLDAADIQTPIIMIGHSYGGYIAQYYALKYPNEVSGLVLVDSSHPDQILKLALLDRPDVRKQQDEKKLVRHPMTSVEQLYWFRYVTSRRGIQTQIQELRFFRQSAIQVKSEHRKLTIPISVVSRGKKQLPTVVSNNQTIDMSNVWQDMQTDFTNLSDKSWKVIAENSGHNIHQTNPGIVVKETLKVLALSPEIKTILARKTNP